MSESAEASPDDAEPGMLRREIVLDDGRAMTFYTFDDAECGDE